MHHEHRHMITRAVSPLLGALEQAIHLALIQEVFSTFMRISCICGGGRLTQQGVDAMIKRAAKKAGINAKVSPHWLRHAHGSHAIDRRASLPEVQATLGHGNISTTSGYLHARPDSSRGLRLDPGVFLR
jgi:site-specific recombinase XerD